MYTFQLAREDLARHTEGLVFEQIWATPHAFGSVGFQLRHIAGVVTLDGGLTIARPAQHFARQRGRGLSGIQNRHAVNQHVLDALG